MIQTKPKEPDEGATYQEKLDLQLRKDRCYTFIYANISSDLKNLITETTDGVVAWKILKDHIEPVTRARVIQFLDDFFGTRYKPGEDVGIFISRVKTAATRLLEAGHKLDDMCIGFQLIRWLPQEFQSTMQQIYRWKADDFRAVKIKAELILEANCLQFMKQDLENGENAYLSSFTSKKSNTFPGATAAAHGDPSGKKDYQKKDGKVTVYPIWKKSDVFHAFIRFQKRVERFLNRKVTAVKTDGGLEFCNKGRKPWVLHIKPFGCLAYAGKRKQIRKKFDLRAKMGIMMGYAQRTKGYRIWLIDENKLVEIINKSSSPKSVHPSRCTADSCTPSFKSLLCSSSLVLDGATLPRSPLNTTITHSLRCGCPRNLFQAYSKKKSEGESKSEDGRRSKKVLSTCEATLLTPWAGLFHAHNHF
ncbi:retrovirus-related Pol polyprotein from transposon TNT 1-94 [Trichonephila clavipes]|uniref:Retrovirus-related Pol polyprotein from transposon TNT 1-94 n=1 Tax=Trichonephila clavipes TaxID=2585209 RepID=A0A8X6SXB3_TRICX|nr:retrovirus-related Pol polyprotein from transposon TNT 1-94 [Trichonephila clavipes]